MTPVARRITWMSSQHFLDELKRFVDGHPEGWSHDEWLGLLHQLSQSGINTEDEASIGLALEKERLNRVLGNLEIKGLGPKRKEALVDRFRTLWGLMEASSEEIAQVPGIPRSMADQISDVLQ